jgi:hypothetical protein
MELVSNFFGGENSNLRNGVIVAALIASAYGIYSYVGSSGSSKDSNLLPALTEEEARKIMSAILDRFQMNIPKLFRAADSIKQQFLQQGQDIDDATLLKQFLLPHLEQGLKDIQEAVLEEYDVDEGDLEDAVTTYIEKGDAELTRISAVIRGVFKKFGADIVDEEDEFEDVPASSNTTTVSTKASSKKSKKEMSADEFIKFFKTFSKMQLAATETAMKEFVEEFGTHLDQTTFGIFQTKLMQASQE